MNKKLSALLLAAGYGTRLRPITNDIPKCLVTINNEPILKGGLKKLRGKGVKNVLLIRIIYLKRLTNLLVAIVLGT